MFRRSGIEASLFDPSNFVVTVRTLDRPGKKNINGQTQFNYLTLFSVSKIVIEGIVIVEMPTIFFSQSEV